MSTKAMQTRINRITRVDKMESLVKVVFVLRDTSASSPEEDRLIVICKLQRQLLCQKKELPSRDFPKTVN